MCLANVCKHTYTVVTLILVLGICEEVEVGRGERVTYNLRHTLYCYILSFLSLLHKLVLPIQLTLEQHVFELCGSTFMCIFSDKYSLIDAHFFLVVFLKTFSLAHFIVRIQYIIHITYRIYVDRLFMLLVRLLSNSRLVVVKWGVKSHTWIFDCTGGSVPLNPMLFKGQLYWCFLTSPLTISSTKGKVF